MDPKKYHGPYRLYLLCLMGMAKVGPDYEIAKKRQKRAKLKCSQIHFIVHRHKMTFEFTFSFHREILILGSSVSERREPGIQADWDQALFVARTCCVSQPAQVRPETGPAGSLGSGQGTTVSADSETAPTPGQEVSAETPDEAWNSP